MTKVHAIKRRRRPDEGCDAEILAGVWRYFPAAVQYTAGTAIFDSRFILRKLVV
jgi:hypothetical protein